MKLLVPALITAALFQSPFIAAEKNGDLRSLEENIPLEVRKTGPIAKDQGLSDAKIKKIVKLPIKTLTAIQNDAGEIVFMSDNGRFVFLGSVYDAWSKEHLETMEQLEKVSDQKRDLIALGVTSKEVGIITKGSGGSVVSIFVDPYCNYCHELIRQAEELYDEYTFQFILTPILGKRSTRDTMKLLCSDDRDKAWKHFKKQTLSALKKNSNPPEVQNDCDPRKSINAITAFRVLGFQGVPVSIAPNKSFKEGRIENLKKWLEKNSQVD